MKVDLALDKCVILGMRTCGTVFAVVEEKNHAIGVHRLSGVLRTIEMTASEQSHC
jgi:hypothetical protein